MKRLAFTVLATVLSSAFLSSASFGYSGTGSGGTCFSYACRIILDEPTRDEALSALVDSSQISGHLRAILENQRELVAAKIGAVAAKAVSDEALLRTLVER